MKRWKTRVRQIYATLSELRQYDAMYNIVERCGYKSAKQLWLDNPLIGGSTNPKDFGLVSK